MNSNSLQKHIPWILNVFLILSILYFFSGIFFGLDFTDSFYHLNQAINPNEGIYLYPSLLSSFIIDMIVEIFGHKVIYLRLINALVIFFSLLIPFFLIRISKPHLKAHFYIACVLILYAPFNYNILGYDTFSIFILSLIFSLIILYLKSSKLHLLILLTFLCSAAVLIRLPNILVIIIVALAIGLNEKIKEGGFSAKSIKLPLIFLFLSSLWISLVFFVYYSSMEEFFRATANSNSHDFKILFYNYFQHGIQLILIILLLLSGHYIFKKTQHTKYKILIYSFLCLFFVLFIGFFVILSPYSRNYSLFLSSLAISILIIHMVKNKEDFLSLKNLIIYLFLLFLFINPFGSDTGLLKAVYLFLLLPFVLSINDIKLNRYWSLVLMVLLPFSLIAKHYGSYDDSGIFSLNRTLELKLLKPIKTTEDRADFLEMIHLEVNELNAKNVQVYFYGDKSQIFHYLYPGTSMNINSFYQPVDDLVYYQKIEDVINGKKRIAIFITDTYPSESSNDISTLELSLIQNGYKRVNKGATKYYMKIEE